MFSPSPRRLADTMASADSDKQALYRYWLLLLRAALLPPSTVYQISTRKKANFLSTYLSDIQPHVSDSFGLRFVLQTHPLKTA